MLPASELDPYRDTISALGDLLRRSEYNDETLAAVFKVGDAVNFTRGAIPIHARRLTSDEGLIGLLRLLILGLPIPMDAAARLFAPVALGDLEAVGLLETNGTVAQALVHITPYSGLLFAHDIDHGSLASDHVIGPHGAAMVLDSVTVRRPVARALDIGTGCGIQALMAARHCESVVATDVNGRALDFGAFNARLNGMDNVEFRLGSLYEPVVGERFDLIVANPPFVLSPEAAYVYRDGGMRGDTLSEAVVAGMPDFLADGGFGHTVCNWIITGDEEWFERPSAWTAGRGCDAVIMHHRMEDPVGYAANWNTELMPFPEKFSAELDRWCNYYAELGVRSIVGGAVLLRRRAGTNWERHVATNATPTREGGVQVERVFNAATEPLGTDDEVLARAFRLVPGHALQQVLRYDADHYDAQSATLAVDASAGLAVDVPAAVLLIVLQLDGETPLGVIAAELAAENDVDAAQLGRAASDAIRNLYDSGLVVPT
jgi:methylase of polypeptide subunit release factors